LVTAIPAVFSKITTTTTTTTIGKVRHNQRETMQHSRVV